MSKQKKVSTKKSVKSIKSSKKVISKKKIEKVEKKTKEPRLSITKLIYALLAVDGPDEVKPEIARDLALSLKPDSAFDKWHLYFHRRNYRAHLLNNEDPQIPAICTEYVNKFLKKHTPTVIATEKKKPIPKNTTKKTKKTKKAKK